MSFWVWLVSSLCAGLVLGALWNNERIPILRKYVVEPWTRFWFLEGPPHALAVVRIFFGLYWLIRFLWFLPNVRLLFSAEGWYFPFIELPGGMVDATTIFFGTLCKPVPVWLAWVLYGFTIVSLVFMTIGYQTRVAIASFVAMFAYYFFLYMHMTNSSYDRMQFMLLLFLVLSPCGKVLSVDASIAKKAGKPFAETQPLWTVRLITVHLSIMYFGTGLFKLVAPAWNTGEVVGTAMISEWGTWLSFGFVRLGWAWGVYDLAVIGTIVFELAMGFMLFSRRWQKPFFVIGLLFHTQIWFLLDIPQFMFMPMCYVLYLAPDEARDLVQRVLARVHGARSGVAAPDRATPATDRK